MIHPKADHDQDCAWRDLQCAHSALLGKFRLLLIHVPNRARSAFLDKRIPLLLKGPRQTSPVGSGVVDYTIDFDLRQAITCPPGQSPACILKPAERLVDNTTVGNIQGVVSNTLVPTGCTPCVYICTTAR